MQALRPFNQNLPFSDFPIYLLWNCCLGPSCTGLFEEDLYLTETSSSAGNRSHAILSFVSANVLPLKLLYFETVCSFMHDISTNSASQNICDLFTCSSDRRSFI